LFLTLWGGGGYHSSPLDIFNIAQKTKSWKNSRNPGGYCKDGFNQAISLYCPKPELRNKRTGQCDIENEDLHIYSFDGSSYLTQTINGFINNHIFPDSNDKNTERRRKVWKYSNYAVSNKEGVARFTKQSGEKNAGFEGGSIQLAQGLKDVLASGQKVEVKRVNNHRLADKNETEYLLQETEEVNMTSIDAYVKQFNIPKVDMLKIDTEGNDNKVILGAMNIIANQVGIFTFEGGGGVSFTSEMSEEFDSYGFNCYSTSRAGLYKWNKGCMKARYLGSFRKKDKGNIFCVNRIRAPLVALAYDILSFPALIDFHFLNTDKSNMNEKDKALYNALFPAEDQAGKNGEEVTLNNKIEQSVLMPIYINIYGFCRPWPSCLTNI
jgi:FkbM family methyltransferase